MTHAHNRSSVFRALAPGHLPLLTVIVLGLPPTSVAQTLNTCVGWVVCSLDSTTNTYTLTQDAGGDAYQFQVTGGGNQLEVDADLIYNVTGNDYTVFSLIATGETVDSNEAVGSGINGANFSVTNSATVSLDYTDTSNVSVLLIESNGSDGYDNTDKDPEDTFNGGDGGDITVEQDGSITVTVDASSEQTQALTLQSVGGDGVANYKHSQLNLGNGGAGGDITITTGSGSSTSITSTTSTAGAFSSAIYALSQSGSPGVNKETESKKSGVGESMQGGSITITHNGSITSNSQVGGFGIFAESVGGDGGTLEYQNGEYGTSAPGGPVTITVNGAVSVAQNDGDSGAGAIAASLAGDSNLDAAVPNTVGGSASIDIAAGGTVVAGQSDAEFSVGALAFTAGTSSILDLFSNDDSSSSGSGYAGDANITNAGSVTTTGSFSVGLAAISVGGAGLATQSESGTLSYVGNDSTVDEAEGGAVDVTNSGTIATSGTTAHGIVALSTGGGGLMLVTEDPGTDDDGNITSGTAVGGSSSSSGSSDGYDAGSVTVQNTGSITTADGSSAASAIIAQSIGGGGGTTGGDHASAWVGDSGGNGGDGGSVDISLSGNNAIATNGQNGTAVIAQSIGGGGGNGANAGGAFFAIGGQGGNGGDGGEVTLELDTGSVATSDAYSHALLLQSIGGGGGNGGQATGFGLFGDATIGGAGGDGGDGSSVDATIAGSVVTSEDSSAGLIAQSIGGGGGAGGTSASGTIGVDVEISIAVGGSGGSGGAGGSVDVANSGSILTGTSATDGEDSIGLLVQSIGGGGGNAGSAEAENLFSPSNPEDPVSLDLDLGIGGTGGDGGAGDAVTATNAGAESGQTATVQTLGNGAHGIVAQSVADGGGLGATTTLSGSFSEDTATAGVTVEAVFEHGTDGGSSSSSGTVTVTNGSSDAGSGSITTAGDNAVGILAQSISGGGGAISGADMSSSLNSIDAEIYLIAGCENCGSSFGESGTVTINNEQNGDISTGGSGAIGVLAQSVSGGGGHVGGAGSYLGYDVSVSISLGDAIGSENENAGQVLVNNDGSIATQGVDAAGIVAQSIAGGGGWAGSTDVSTTGDMTAPASATYQASTLTGNEGQFNSDTGNVVSVANTAGSYANGVLDPGISTQGDRAYGILAQSIGSGGGWAGTGFIAPANGSVGGSATLTVNNGTIEGAYQGGDGGPVTIDNSGAIATSGFAAHGLVAQSIGASGGVIADGTVALSEAMLYNGAWYGSSSDGNAGTVTVDQSGWTATGGDNALGLLAQSIGGGGGLVSSGSPGLTTGSTITSTAYLATLGNNALGLDSDISQGGSVTVDLSGGIQTDGDWSHGMVAQSVGAGGGLTSTASPTSVTDTEFQVVVGWANGNNDDSGGGNSGAVDLVLNNATITTGAVGSGYSAYGLLAQSIGGGGGIYSANSQSATHSQPLSQTIYTGYDFAVGYGGYGNASSVSLSGADADGNPTSSTFATSGESAHALLLQSIGASGGIAGQGNSNGVQASGELPQTSVSTVEGTGYGGDIEIDQLTAVITTAGDHAYGVLAQSIGGGGGLGFFQYPDRGDSRVGISPTNDSDNAAGTLTIGLESGSTITTAGFGAYGIVVQAIGGSGGIANYMADSSLLLSSTASDTEDVLGYVNQNPSGGDGGDVDLTVYDITTTGEGAHGILAQSIGGGGGMIALDGGVYLGSTAGSGDAVSNANGGGITIDSKGDISTTGNNSIGIFAQSVGSQSDGTGGGDISITVEGSVTGGSGSGAAIWVDQGSDNGLITVDAGGSISALSGQAIALTGQGLLNVTNNGTITGSVDLTNDVGEVGTLTNNSSNTLYAGPAIEAHLINNGRLDLRSRDPRVPYQTVTLSGDFRQTERGVLQFNADPLASEGDLLRVGGDAELAGGFLIETPGAVLPGRRVSVLEVAGDAVVSLVHDGSASPLIDFDILSVGGGRYAFAAAGADFAPDAAELERDERAVASGLTASWNSGGNAAMASLFGALNQIAADSWADYAAVLDAASPKSLVGLGARQTQDLLAFNDSVLDQSLTTGDEPLAVGQFRFWADATGSHTHQDADGGIGAFDLDHTTVQLGGSYRLAPSWTLGAAAAYRTSRLDGDDGRVDADGRGGLFAAFARYRDGQWRVTGSLFGATSDYDARRHVDLPAAMAARLSLPSTLVAKSSPSLYGLGLMLDASHRFEQGQAYLQPGLAVGAVLSHSGSDREHGADLFNLSYDDETQSSWVLRPHLRVGGRFDLPERRVLAPYADLGITLLSNDDWRQGSAFSIDPASGFTTAMPMDDVSVNLRAGVRWAVDDHLALDLQYAGELSERVSSHAGSLAFNWRF